uniref:glycoside hydrolase family 3 N-terminal domain-containing protein n=1 Tax=Acetatifactor sp. TaxID=1872090 RepID=UPI004057B67F
MKNKQKFLIGGAVLVVLVLIFLALYKNVFIQTEDVDNSVTAESSEEVTPESTEDVLQESSEASSQETASGEEEVAEVDKSVYMDSTKPVEERVEALLAQMTLEEKAAQMVQPEQNGLQYFLVKKYGIGSVLSGGGSAPRTGNSAESWQSHINQMKQAALESRLGIPLIYGVDAVHGHSNLDNATIFPHNIGLGAANDTDLMERMGAVVAEEVRATGIQWTFAPTLANPQNELWGRTYEGFGEDVELVAALGAAFIKGAQGELGDANVVATAKHYIGEGYTVAGINQGDVVMDEAEFETLLRETLLVPYKEAVDAGVRTVMVSFNSVNGLKCHENGYLVNDVLKGELGFTGFVIGDYNGVQQVSGATYKEQIANAVNAGVDMLMEPYTWEEVIGHIVANVEDGSISRERVDDAVRRILRVKFEAGLFEEQIGSETESGLLSGFGSDEHREIAREAVRKSLVLLKNDTVNGQTAMQALAESQNILVVGKKADDIGTQCGGWTISWQGSTGDIIEGTTILEGLQNAAGDRTITHNTDGTVTGEEDAIIVVVGENPYAETNGDRSTSNLILVNEDRALIASMKDSIAEARANGVPVILMLMTGRPVGIAEYVDQFDAIVEAWLPGTEGDGVADVLLGEYDFTGTLTYTWTWTPDGIVTKFEEGNEDAILFANGTGLTKDGSSIKEVGTVEIGEAPASAVTEEETSEGDTSMVGVAADGSINLESTNYVLEAEHFNSDSYLVQMGDENNITFVENWGGQWANTKWNVWLPKAGNYKLHFYIAAAKDSSNVSIYYASPKIEDDGNANKTAVPMTTTEDMMTYEDFTLDVYLDGGNYEFKFMTDTADAADFRLDRIEFEYLD